MRGNAVGDVGGGADRLAHEVEAQRELARIGQLGRLVDEPVVVVAHLLGGGDAERRHHGEVVAVDGHAHLGVADDLLKQQIRLLGPTCGGREAVFGLRCAVHGHAVRPLANEHAGRVAEGLVEHGLVHGEQLERELVADGVTGAHTVCLHACDGLLDACNAREVGAGVLQQVAVEEAVDIGEAGGDERIAQLEDLGPFGDEFSTVAAADGSDAVALDRHEARMRLGGRCVEDRVGTEDDVCHGCSYRHRQVIAYFIPIAMIRPASEWWSDAGHVSASGLKTAACC